MKPLYFLLVVAACKAKSGTSTSKPELRVSIAGKPVAIQHAFIKSFPVEGNFSVHLSEDKSSCKELLEGLYFGRGERVLFTIGNRLAKDGTLASQVVDLFRGGKTVTISPKSSATTKPAGANKVELAIEATANVEDEGPLTISGTIVAETCGAQTWDPADVPKATHASTAKVTVGGHEQPLLNAIHKAGPDELTLSTAPITCGPSTPSGAVMLVHDRSYWRLKGLWFSNNQGFDDPEMRVHVDEPGGKDLVANPGATGTSTDGPTRQYELSGATKIGGYTVALSGSIEALECQ